MILCFGKLFCFDVKDCGLLDSSRWTRRIFFMELLRAKISFVLILCENIFEKNLKIMFHVKMSVKLFECWINDNQKLIRIVNSPEIVEIMKNNVGIYKNFENEPSEKLVDFLNAISKNMSKCVNIKVSRGDVVRNGN